MPAQDLDLQQPYSIGRQEGVESAMDPTSTWVLHVPCQVRDDPGFFMCRAKFEMTKLQIINLEASYRISSAIIWTPQFQEQLWMATSFLDGTPIILNISC
jgi:hypothetical protein